jgi:hypothetical protein
MFWSNQGILMTAKLPLTAALHLTIIFIYSWHVRIYSLIADK